MQRCLRRVSRFLWTSCFIGRLNSCSETVGESQGYISGSTQRQCDISYRKSCRAIIASALSNKLKFSQVLGCVVTKCSQRGDPPDDPIILRSRYPASRTSYRITNRGTCRRKELSAKEPSPCDCMASWIVVSLQSKVDAVLPAREIIIVLHWWSVQGRMKVYGAIEWMKCCASHCMKKVGS